MIFFEVTRNADIHRPKKLKEQRVMREFVKSTWRGPILKAKRRKR